MVIVIKPYANAVRDSKAIQETVVKLGLTEVEREAYLDIVSLAHGEGIDIGRYSREAIKGLQSKNVVFLTMSLKTSMYVLLVGTVRMSVNMLKINVVGGSGSRAATKHVNTGKVF